MAYINLLPWREEAERAKQRDFFIILGGLATFSLLIIIVIGQYYQARIDGQNVRNQYLSNEIAKVDVRIAEIKTLKSKKKSLQERINVIEQLQRSRNVATQVLDEIAKIVPAGIYLVKLDKKGDNIQILGKSESNNHLANMIRGVERSKLFDNATLESIETNDARSKLLSDFKMKIHIKRQINKQDNKSAKGGK
jgi:type IV pilus assembly protein PilN